MGIGRGVGIGLKSHRGPLEDTFAPLLLNLPAVCSTQLFGFVFYDLCIQNSKNTNTYIGT